MILNLDVALSWLYDAVVWHVVDSVSGFFRFLVDSFNNSPFELILDDGVIFGKQWKFLFHLLMRLVSRA